MGVIISVYTQEIFREFVMPSINNADYDLVLNKKDFGTTTDIILNFEIIDHVWKLKTGKDYRVLVNKEEMTQTRQLDSTEILQIETLGNRKIIAMCRFTDNVFSAFEKYDIRRIGRISIGDKEGHLIQFQNHQLISGDHAEIIHKGSSFVINCIGHNGLYINNKYMKSSVRLTFGDFINIYGLHVVFLGDILAVDTNNENVVIDEAHLPSYAFTQKEKEKDNFVGAVKQLFHRSPRLTDKIENEPIEIEEPPQETKSEKKPLLMTIGPSFTMAIPMLFGSLLMIASYRSSGVAGGLFMYSGLVMAGSSAAIGVIWGLSNLKYQKKVDADREAHRYEAYSEYLVKKTELVREKYRHNRQTLLDMYPDAETCLGYNEKSSRLWNRNSTHADFLSVRLGSGELPFQAPIEIPKERFRLYRDELSEKPEFILNNYKKLTDVPIVIDLLEHKLVGIVGGEEKKGAYDIARVMMTQIAACNCYTDVKLIFVYDKNNSDDQGQWEFAKWLPHVWSQDKKTRYIASDKQEAGEIFYELTNTLRIRLENDKPGVRDKGIPYPYYIMFLSDPSLIDDEMIAKYVYDPSQKIGLSTVMLVSRAEELPNACEYIVENDRTFCGVYNVSAQKEERTDIKFDSVDIPRLETFCRGLSNIEVQETQMGGDIPSSLTFFEMYGITKPEELGAPERWLKNRTYENIRGLLGQKAGGAPCYMDVHEKYHGPHGLVAGTTGSGKSETLQTYVLSLAANYSPEDIGFFIIDYKGGGMANLFEGLPHMIGQISNLSGNQVYRAMVSIKSENRRRQRIFSENGVNNINSYTKLYKNKEASEPIPHLFIIIDEFAELKREQPEFMKELISVAQVGRSLGVHLILATQKPSGTVDENIWSNSKFRLCLRVQDRQDSNDMLHKPDAAYITQAGRCYLQVGSDEVYELFQSGWSGAPYDERLEDNKEELARIVALTGKTEKSGSHARNARKEQSQRLWVSCILDALAASGIADADNLERIRKSENYRNEQIAVFMEKMMELQPDFQNNQYNLKRLESFVLLYAAAKRLYPEGDKEGIAAVILQMSKIQNIKLPEMKEHTQLDAVKDYLKKTAVQQGYKEAHKLWLPVLRDKIYLDEFESYRENCFADGKWKIKDGAWGLDTVIGMIDDPQNQAQLPVSISFSEGGHHAVIGSVVTGKSTLLQTTLYGLIQKYSPQELNIYGLDFSNKSLSAFETQPGVGGIMYENDEKKISRFFVMMEKILNDRKKAITGVSYEQYVRKNGMVYPSILLVIDNFSAFMEKTDRRYENFLIQLSKEGVNYGMFLLLSANGLGSMNEIPNRIAENIKTVLTLQMKDKFSYGDALHTMQIPVMPEENVKGRGLIWFNGQVLEYQAALALKAEGDFQRMEKIVEKCQEMAAAWQGKCADPVPEIPDKPKWSDLYMLPQFKRDIETDHLLPAGYNSANAEVYSLDLSDLYCYLITGQAKTGRKNFMRILMESALLKHAEICLIDGDGVLSQYNGRNGITYVQDADGLFQYLMSDLAVKFSERNQYKIKVLNEGREVEEMYEYTRKYIPIFIFITDMKWFIEMIYDPENSERNFGRFLETLLEKGKYHNIYFIGTLNIVDKNEIRGYSAFRNFVSYKTGIHFGGTVDTNDLLDYSYLSYKEQAAKEVVGIGMLPEVDGALPVKRVVVPLMTNARVSEVRKEGESG